MSVDLQPWEPGLPGKAIVFGSKDYPGVMIWAAPDGEPHHYEVAGAEGIGNFLACEISPSGGVSVCFGDPTVAQDVVEKDPRLHIDEDDPNSWLFSDDENPHEGDPLGLMAEGRRTAPVASQGHVSQATRYRKVCPDCGARVHRHFNHHKGFGFRCNSCGWHGAKAEHETVAVPRLAEQMPPMLPDSDEYFNPAEFPYYYEHPDYDYDQYMPGRPGKGFVLPNGRAATWNIGGSGIAPTDPKWFQIAGPHHSELAQNIGLHYYPENSEEIKEEDRQDAIENGYEHEEPPAGWHSPISIDAHGNYEFLNWNDNFRKDEHPAFTNAGLRRKPAEDAWRFSSEPLLQSRPVVTRGDDAFIGTPEEYHVDVYKRYQLGPEKWEDVRGIIHPNAGSVEWFGQMPNERAQRNINNEMGIKLYHGYDNPYEDKEWKIAAQDWHVTESDFNPEQTFFPASEGHPPRDDQRVVVTHLPTRQIIVGQPGTHHADLINHHGLDFEAISDLPRDERAYHEPVEEDQYGWTSDEGPSNFPSLHYGWISGDGGYSHWGPRVPGVSEALHAHDLIQQPDGSVPYVQGPGGFAPKYRRTDDWHFGKVSIWEPPAPHWQPGMGYGKFIVAPGNKVFAWQNAPNLTGREERDGQPGHFEYARAHPDIDADAALEDLWSPKPEYTFGWIAPDGTLDALTDAANRDEHMKAVKHYVPGTKTPNDDEGWTFSKTADSFDKKFDDGYNLPMVRVDGKDYYGGDGDFYHSEVVKRHGLSEEDMKRAWFGRTDKSAPEGIRWVAQPQSNEAEWWRDTVNRIKQEKAVWEGYGPEGWDFGKLGAEWMGTEQDLSDYEPEYPQEGPNTRSIWWHPNHPPVIGSGPDVHHFDQEMMDKLGLNPHRVHAYGWRPFFTFDGKTLESSSNNPKELEQAASSMGMQAHPYGSWQFQSHTKTAEKFIYYNGRIYTGPDSGYHHELQQEAGIDWDEGMPEDYASGVITPDQGVELYHNRYNHERAVEGLRQNGYPNAHYIEGYDYGWKIAHTSSDPMPEGWKWIWDREAQRGHALPMPTYHHFVQQDTDHPMYTDMGVIGPKGEVEWYGGEQPNEQMMQWLKTIHPNAHPTTDYHEWGKGEWGWKFAQTSAGPTPGEPIGEPQGEHEGRVGREDTTAPGESIGTYNEIIHKWQPGQDMRMLIDSNGDIHSWGEVLEHGAYMDEKMPEDLGVRDVGFIDPSGETWLSHGHAHADALKQDPRLTLDPNGGWKMGATSSVESIQGHKYVTPIVTPTRQDDPKPALEPATENTPDPQSPSEPTYSHLDPPMNTAPSGACEDRIFMPSEALLAHLRDSDKILDHTPVPFTDTRYTGLGSSLDSTHTGVLAVQGQALPHTGSHVKNRPILRELPRFESIREAIDITPSHQSKVYYYSDRGPSMEHVAEVPAWIVPQRAQPWKPGVEGKGYVTQDARYRWAIDDSGAPHHAELFHPAHWRNGEQVIHINRQGEHQPSFIQIGDEGIEYAPAQGDWKFGAWDTPWRYDTDPLLPWEPGREGKGMFHGGEPVTWALSDQWRGPHHADVAYMRDPDEQTPINGYFHIAPDGTVEAEGAGDAQAFIAHDPRLKLPLDSDWRFSESQGSPADMSGQWNIMVGDRDASNTSYKDSAEYFHWPVIVDEDERKAWLGRPGSHHQDLHDDFDLDPFKYSYDNHHLIYPVGRKLIYDGPQDPDLMRELEKHTGQEITPEGGYRFGSESHMELTAAVPAPKFIHHDNLHESADPLSDSIYTQGYEGRIPLVYDHRANIVHVGQPDFAHQDLLSAMSHAGYSTLDRALGWVGHNPEAYSDDEENFGWYTTGPPPHVNQAIADHFGFRNVPKGDMSDWHFGAEQYPPRTTVIEIDGKQYWGEPWGDEFHAEIAKKHGLSPVQLAQAHFGLTNNMGELRWLTGNPQDTQYRMWNEGDIWERHGPEGWKTPDSPEGFWDFISGVPKKQSGQVPWTIKEWPDYPGRNYDKSFAARPWIANWQTQTIHLGQPAWYHNDILSHPDRQGFEPMNGAKGLLLSDGRIRHYDTPGPGVDEALQNWGARGAEPQGEWHFGAVVGPSEGWPEVPDPTQHWQALNTKSQGWHVWPYDGFEEGAGDPHAVYMHKNNIPFEDAIDFAHYSPPGADWPQGKEGWTSYLKRYYDDYRDIYEEIAPEYQKGKDFENAAQPTAQEWSFSKVAALNIERFDNIEHGAEPWNYGPRQGSYPIIFYPTTNTLAVGRFNGHHHPIIEAMTQKHGPQPLQSHMGFMNPEKGFTRFFSGPEANPELTQWLAQEGVPYGGNADWHFSATQPATEYEAVNSPLLLPDVSGSRLMGSHHGQAAPWRLGQMGKGLIRSNGEAYLWRAEAGDPHHPEVLMSVEPHYNDRDMLKFTQGLFTIEPNGEVQQAFWEQGRPKDFSKLHPDLYPHDPTEDWTFSKVATKVQEVSHDLEMGAYERGRPVIHDPRSNTVYIGEDGALHWDMIHQVPALQELYGHYGQQPEGTPPELGEGASYARFLPDDNHIEYIWGTPGHEAVTNALSNHFGVPLTSDIQDQPEEGEWKFGALPRSYDPWTPGEMGKGGLVGNEVVHWKTDGESPTHYQVVNPMVNPGYNRNTPIDYTKMFWIHPNGTLRFWRTPDQNTIKEVMNQIPGSNYQEGEIEPYEKGWQEENPEWHNFSRTASTPIPHPLVPISDYYSAFGKEYEPWELGKPGKGFYDSQNHKLIAWAVNNGNNPERSNFMGPYHNNGVVPEDFDSNALIPFWLSPEGHVDSSYSSLIPKIADMHPDLKPQSMEDKWDFGPRFGADNVQNGGHVFNRYLEQDLPEPRVTEPWQLGLWGKAALLDNKLHMWGIKDSQGDYGERFDPHHDGIFSLHRGDIGWEDPEFNDMPKAIIGPDGTIERMRTFGGDANDAELDRQIAAMHPDLKAKDLSTFNFGSAEDGKGYEWGLSEPHAQLHIPEGWKDAPQRSPFVYTVNQHDPNDVHVYLGHPGSEHADILDPGGLQWSYANQDYVDVPAMHPNITGYVGGYGAVKPRSFNTGNPNDTERQLEFYTVPEPHAIKAVADVLSAHPAFGLPQEHGFQPSVRNDQPWEEQQEPWDFTGAYDVRDPLPEPHPEYNRLDAPINPAEVPSWRPGEFGKFVGFPDGYVHAWANQRNPYRPFDEDPIEARDGWPPHDRMAEAIGRKINYGIDDEESPPGHTFGWISPEGAIQVINPKDPVARRHIDSVKKMHPDTYEEGEGSWMFAKAA